MKIKLKLLKQIVTDSGLFDSAYYFDNYQNSKFLNKSSIDHYCKIGIKKDFKPNASFDPIWYREFYQDIQEDNSYPFVHYAVHGFIENRFQNEIERDHYELIKDSTVFDAQYYQENGLELQGITDPLLHYIRFGIQENRRPNAHFDSVLYKEFNENLNSDGTYPVDNFIKHALILEKTNRPQGGIVFEGFLDGDLIGSIDKTITKLTIAINDKFIGQCYHEELIPEAIDRDYKMKFKFRLDGKHFDYDWLFLKEIKIAITNYQEEEETNFFETKIQTQELIDSIAFNHNIPLSVIELELENSMLWDESFYKKQINPNRYQVTSPLSDYILFGSKNLNDASSFFSTNFYIQNNEDVAIDGVNPLYHYLTSGEKEGRLPNNFFDPEVYLRLNPDLSSWDKSLLAHYIQYGRAEGRHYCDRRIVSFQNNDDPYKKWIANNETELFQEIATDLLGFTNNPLISIVVPVYNPDKELLSECIQSVLNQSYTNWELCIADDLSTKKYVREVLEECSINDDRIKVVFREENGHISAASNSALELATGEWVALLDHDDELHQHALFHVVKTLNKEPDTQLIYSDEDKINEAGDRIDPHFKSDWNLDLLYSQNYVSHLGVYKADIVRRIGGFRLGYEGSQDYDLLLRYSREIDHANIAHIPKILYHWRIVEGSTALDSGEKSYTTDAGIKALKNHFKELNLPVNIKQGKNKNTYKVNWKIKKEPLVSLIIPTYNGYEITKQAIDSILQKTTYKNYEILLVDNNSNDETALAYFDEIGQHDRITVIRYPHAFNYSAINNFAVEQVEGEIIGLINNDVEVITPEWLTEMVSHAQRKDVGCVGAMLYYPNDTIQHAGVVCGLGGVAGHSHKNFPRNHHGYFTRLELIQNYSAVTAACLLVRREVFKQVNGLNEKDLTVAFNDVDFCLKVQKAGYRNLWTPYAELYHHESISRGVEDNPEKIARFNKEANYMKNTWKTNEKTDVCYSPNLSVSREDFSIK